MRRRRNRASEQKTDLDAVERLLGSVAFANFVRSVMLVERDPEADQDADQFRFVLGKHNLAPGGDDLVYRSVNVGEDLRSQYVRLESSRPSGGNIDITKLFERKAASERKKSAREWIIAFLEENGPTPGKDVMEAGEAAGYERDALAKAQYREPRSNRTDRASTTVCGSGVWHDRRRTSRECVCPSDVVLRWATGGQELSFYTKKDITLSLRTGVYRRRTCPSKKDRQTRTGGCPPSSNL
jgi:hypothetical protein